jgi:hypothetical protein
MKETGKKDLSRRGFLAAVISIAMAFSLLAIPLSASATPPNTDYYYVWDIFDDEWVAAPMGQDTVDSVTDNKDGTYTIRLGYGYYYSEIYDAELIGKVITFEGTSEGTDFWIDDPTPDGGYVTFKWDPSVDPNYILLDKLDIVFTYADDPDWNDPIEHIALYDVAFCPFGGPPDA